MDLKLENGSQKGSHANYKLSHHMELKLEKGDCHPARERKKRIKPFGFKHGQSKEFVTWQFKWQARYESGGFGLDLILSMQEFKSHNWSII